MKKRKEFYLKGNTLMVREYDEWYHLAAHRGGNRWQTDRLDEKVRKATPREIASWKRRMRMKAR